MQDETENYTGTKTLPEPLEDAGLNSKARIQTSAKGPEVTKLLNDLQDVGRAVQSWIEAHRGELNALRRVAQELLSRLPEWQRNAQANLLLLEQGLKILEDNNVGAAKYVLSMYEVLEYAQLSVDEFEQKLYDETSSEEFLQALVDMYRRLGLRENRVPLLREAVLLHREGRFAASIPLALSQAEGVIADALVEAGIAQYDGGTKLIATGKTGASSSKSLPGIHAKVSLARDHSAENAEFFDEFIVATLLATADGETLTKARNAILHGQDTDYANRDQSVRLMLWLCALLGQIQVLTTARVSGSI